MVAALTRVILQLWMVSCQELLVLLILRFTTIVNQYDFVICSGHWDGVFDLIRDDILIAARVVLATGRLLLRVIAQWVQIQVVVIVIVIVIVSCLVVTTTATWHIFDHNSIHSWLRFRD